MRQSPIHRSPARSLSNFSESRVSSELMQLQIQVESLKDSLELKYYHVPYRLYFLRGLWFRIRLHSYERIEEFKRYFMSSCILDSLNKNTLTFRKGIDDLINLRREMYQRSRT